MNVAISDVELEDLSMSKDSVVQLKAAFLYFIRRNIVSVLKRLKFFAIENSHCLVI